MAETYEELQKLTYDELIARHNRAVDNVEFKDDFYLRALNWRIQQDYTKQIRYLTWAIAGLTLVVTIATVVQVALALT